MKKRSVAIICIAAFLLSGCGSSFPKLTDKEAEAIGEYAAITLLKYDANGRSRLVDLSEVEEEPVMESTPEVEVKPEEVVPESPQVQEPVNDESANMMAESIEDFFEMPEGVSISYSGYEVCQSYQEEDGLYFVLEATSGKTLLVAKFAIQNDSFGAQDVNLLQRDDSYRLTVNGNYSRTALTTMLSNDMTTYKGSLDAGETEEVVLVIEVDSETAQDVQSISLNLKNESKTYTIQVL